MNYKEKAIRQEFLEGMEAYYGKYSHPKLKKNGDLNEFYYKSLEDAYADGAFGRKISQDDFTRLIEKINYVQVRKTDVGVSVWYKGEYITWATNMSVIPEYSIMKEDITSQDQGKVLAHGWERMLKIIERKIPGTEKYEILSKIKELA